MVGFAVCITLDSIGKAVIIIRNQSHKRSTVKDLRFRYVPTDQNPADFASRGTTLAELRDNQLWWHGPTWLSMEESEWPYISEQFRIEPETLEKIASEEKKS